MSLPQYMHRYIASDYAVTSAEDARDPDYTVHVVVGLASDDKAYVLDRWRGQQTADIWINELCNLVDKHKPMCVFGEAGVIQRATEPLLKTITLERQCYFRMEWVTSMTDKAARARSLQAWAASGRLLFPKTAWADEMIEELVGFQAGAKHDDQVDALSLFFRALDMAHKAIVPIAQKRESSDKYRSDAASKGRTWLTR